MGILSMLGLSKVNEEYIAPLKERLEGVEEKASTIGGIADSGSQIIEAVKAKKLGDAVTVLLEHFELKEGVDDLKEVKKKIDEGEKAEAAVAGADAAKLGPQIMTVVTEGIAEQAEAITGLVPDIQEFVTEVGDKVKNIKNDFGSFSWAEKVGTPAAVVGLAKQAKGLLETANETKDQLAKLKDAIAGQAS